MTTSHPDGVTLNDYADEALTGASRAAVRDHLAQCEECRTVVDGLRAVRSAARALPPLQPSPKAWERIERSLAVPRAGRSSIGWTWLAAAAVLILATFVGFKTLRRPAQTAGAPGAAVQATEPADAQFVEAELRQAEEHYQKAITGLEQIANSGKGSLDPQTAATLEKNLSVVDQAISESRAALRTQPSNEPAQASLLESFKAKIELLQETVALINEMRKGPSLNQKGT